MQAVEPREQPAHKWSDGLLSPFLHVLKLAEQFADPRGVKPLESVATGGELELLRLGALDLHVADFELVSLPSGQTGDGRYVFLVGVVDARVAKEVAPGAELVFQLFLDLLHLSA